MRSSRNIAKEIHKEIHKSENPVAFFEKTIEVLKKEKKEHLVPKILEYLLTLEEKREKHDSLYVRFGKEPEKESVEKVKKYLNAEGDIITEVDENLIGGFVAEHKGVIYDGSVAGYLRNLKRDLKAIH